MNAQSSKNLVKKLVSFAGIASTTLFFSFPSFALTNPNASSLNQLPQKGQGTLPQTKERGTMDHLWQREVKRLGNLHICMYIFIILWDI